MSASSIGGTGLATATALNENRFAELSSNEFINILVTELKNQDPFEPNDSAQILEQLSSLRNIEAFSELQDQLGTVVDQMQVAQAGAMIGRLVEGVDSRNNQVVGQVTSVRVVHGKGVLELDTGRSLEMDRITRIMTPAQDLIGLLVQGLDDQNNPIEGVVSSVNLESGEMTLELTSGRTLSMERVTQISRPLEEPVLRQRTMVPDGGTAAML